VPAQNLADSEAVEFNRCNRCPADQRNAEHNSRYTSDVTGKPTLTQPASRVFQSPNRLLSLYCAKTAKPFRTLSKPQSHDLQLYFSAFLKHLSPIAPCSRKNAC
jgi:hypothetical protein